MNRQACAPHPPAKQEKEPVAAAATPANGEKESVAVTATPSKTVLASVATAATPAKIEKESVAAVATGADALLVDACAPRATVNSRPSHADNASMRVLPHDRLAVIEFCESRFEVWDLDPPLIGLTKEQMGPFHDQMKAAREKYDLAIKAREASMAATAAMRTEVAALRAMAAAYVATIKAYAAGGGQEGYPADRILAMAQIDPASAGGRGRGGPGRAVRISTSVLPTGAIRLTWQAQRAAASTGAFFTVSRRLAGEAGFTILGTSPGLSRTRRRADFTDDSVPAGIGSVEYQIVGNRGRGAGAVREPSEVVTVTMGVVMGVVMGAERQAA